MNYMYSAATNSFYPISMMSDYKNADTWPVDVLAVNDNIYFEFTAEPEEGKRRIVGEDGMPAWGDVPPPSHDEQVATAENKKSALLAEAQATISIWQTELQLGIISDGDKASLLNWLTYLKELQAIDTDAAPDINWPAAPVV